MLVDDVEVGIDRLDREEAAEAPAAAPADDEIESGDLVRAYLAPLQPGEIPFPVLIHEEGRGSAPPAPPRKDRRGPRGGAASP